ncbi:MAG: hypothetical protein A2W31_02905 [Planctomycetes bacterium RBG_16_64_10]|nr:MAG: hypothetical protein A2W31_02905 [Planctomycetes bacterium RBG_16_64_10]
MLAWWQWSLLALVPPAIVALYFLKLKRTPLEVPSTYLWRKSIEDLHVNRLWQRLRQNILLLLQLLVLLLAMTALVRPGWRGTTLLGTRSIFLVDHSASMSATDVRPSRLEEAKRRVGELIEQSASGSEAMIISFADTAQVVQEFTDNRRLLRQRLQTIQPTARGTALLGALQLAAGLANPGRTATEAGDQQVADPLPATLYLFSDGNFPAVPDFALGNLTPVFIAIGRPDADNVAITAFMIRPSEAGPQRLQAFGQLANHGRTDREVTVELLMNDVLIDADQLRIQADGSRGVVFDLGEVPSGSLRLQINSTDPLVLDDVAQAGINTPRRGRVLLVTPGNAAVQSALATRHARELAVVETAGPDVLSNKQYQQESAAGRYDLVIYDQCRPAEMPQANTLLIGRLPPRANWHGDRPAKAVSGPQVIDTDRDHPVMQLVDLDGILIGASATLDPPQGSTVLIDSNLGKLAAIGPRGAFQDLVLAFEIVHTTAAGAVFNTNWPLGQLSFPTFFLNVLTHLGGGQGPAWGASVRPGDPIQLRSDVPADTLQVVTPRGAVESVPRDRNGSFSFRRTEELGIYRVQQEGAVTGRFAVNLLDGVESDIRTRRAATVQIGYIDVTGQGDWEPARLETWRFLLLSALGVLLVEWYIYCRRVTM